MPGAVPRARGEEVTVGVSLPQPRSKRAATVEWSHGSQCDWTPVFSKAWIQGEKSQQARATQWSCCCKPTACAVPAWPIHCTHCARSCPHSPRTQQRWSQRLCSVSASSTAVWPAPGPNRWYNPASQHGSQLHSGSDGAAGLAQARLLPDVGIAWLALSQRLRAADDSGHQNSHVPTSYSVCSTVLESWACCCHHLDVRLRRLACWGSETTHLPHISPCQLHPSPCPTARVVLAVWPPDGKTWFHLCYWATPKHPAVFQSCCWHLSCLCHHNVLGVSGALREQPVTWQPEQEQEASFTHRCRHRVTRFPKLKTWNRSDIPSSFLPQSAHSLSNRRLYISAAAGSGKPHPISCGWCAREPGEN